jgi:hypothetical protein
MRTAFRRRHFAVIFHFVIVTDVQAVQPVTLPSDDLLKNWAIGSQHQCASRITIASVNILIAVLCQNESAIESVLNYAHSFADPDGGFACLR